MFRIPRAAAALAATAAVLTLAGSTVATAAGTSAPARQTASPAVQAIVCTVNDNGVNYRGGPGTNYPVLGQVNRGQKMNARGREGSWIMGDLWGGRTGVWIHAAYLDC
ncbi:SH3 domain-containing protein [Streptomyces albofaciens JCM 4342]|uniref:SH3 domain-containing protein n=1 Tax=Streptomyces albofaciens TaxID=66866 RepID=UPI0012389947|nr:SH3 domain-containing protein [Streptomyces albofaciens]KAA6213012.1 SH3 domain-containing protein [Streptomyces albofaciens JCM 4342]